jgi:hypothetical protein
MSARVYMLLDIVEGKSAHAARVLRAREGVVITDVLEGRPDIIVMVEAPDRQRLAEVMMPVLSSIEDITKDVQLLVAREDGLSADLHEPGSGPFHGKKTLRNSARRRH